MNYTVYDKDSQGHSRGPAPLVVQVKLTRKQRAFYDYLRAYIGEHGQSPTTARILRDLGLSSPGTVAFYVRRLEKLGLLQRRPPGRMNRSPRGIRLAPVFSPLDPPDDQQPAGAGADSPEALS